MAVYENPMEATVPFIPWPTPGLWREANDSIQHTLQRNRDALAPCRHLAHELRRQMTALFPIMDHLCRATCPTCADVCCRRACVWIDFKDLLLLHLADIPLPDGQLLGSRGEHCRYGAPDGCRLDRIQRPFVCTWYLCPAQTQRLRRYPRQMARIMEALQRVKQLRQEMEMLFIRAVNIKAAINSD